MAHPAFEAIRDACRAYPHTVEEYPWGCVVWKVAGKVFAISEEEGAWVTLASTPDEQEVLVQDPAVTSASHMGRFGWVTVTVSDDSSRDLALELIDRSRAQVIGKLSKKKREALV